MGPDDLLCSRNARSRTPLVGRAQWKISQPPSLERNEQAWRDHIYRSMRVVKDSLAAPLEGEVGKNEKDGMGGLLASCVRATRTLGRCSLDVRSGSPNRPPSREEKVSKLGGIIW
ncbi:MAG: Prepilin-type N-terminal cleavage/methylation protein [candidate division NC10 bacterium]|nr:Prepilin-type N-terminal cleavage/methylation protein [candidate division NC10 bacterium]